MKKQYYGIELKFRVILVIAGISLINYGLIWWISKSIENHKDKIITASDGHQYLKTLTNTIHLEGCNNETHKTSEPYEN